MPIINADLSGHVEPEVVKDAGPYDLRVVQIDTRDVEVKGVTKQVIEVLLRIENSGLVNPKPIRYSLWLPSTGDTPQQKNSNQGRILKFKKACNDDCSDGLNTDVCLGATFPATLKIVTDDYGDKNEIRRIMV